MRASSMAFCLVAVCTSCGDDGDGMSSALDDAGRPDAAVSTERDAGVGPGIDIPIAAALSDGQVVAPWDMACVATFTRDFDVLSLSGDVAFTIQTGDRYLLGSGDFFSDATIIYIGDGTAAAFKLDFAGRSAPFDSSCGGNPGARIGVFVDTVMYADEALTTPVCTVEAGQLLPASGYSFVLAGQGYSVDLAGLGRLCDGVTMGYVKPVVLDTDAATIRSLPFIGVQVH